MKQVQIGVTHTVLRAPYNTTHRINVVFPQSSETLEAWVAEAGGYKVTGLQPARRRQLTSEGPVLGSPHMHLIVTITLLGGTKAPPGRRRGVGGWVHNSPKTTQASESHAGLPNVGASGPAQTRETCQSR